jgi:NADH-quinone oxidoreductase subunit M
VALLFGLGALAATIVLLNNFAGENISVLNQWINKPQVSIALTDGLSLAMLLLTTALTAVIIFTSFENVYKMQKRFMP